MNFEDQILFFLSALGAFNGLFLSLYFAFFIKKKSKSTYFLAALLFVISVRVTKSVFLEFYPGTSSAFVGVGLTACFLIGPFLYLHTKDVVKPDSIRRWTWLVHIVPVIIFMIIISIVFPYREHKELWWRTPPRPLGSLLFLQWTIYVFVAIFHARKSFKKLFSTSKKITTLDFWVLNIVIGGFLIWLAYNTTRYTSYIVGALSFSFTFYITLIIWFLRRRKNSLSFLVPQVKYANKKIGTSKAKTIGETLQFLFEEKKIHLNKALKLSDVAKELQISSHELSQYLNETIGMSFSNYINVYRVATAEKALRSNHIHTLEAIGNESGFKSNSTFYAAFKKHKGLTPAQYKKSLK